MDLDATIQLESIRVDPFATNRLWHAHWDETETQYRPAPINPDWKAFLAYEDSGWGRYFTLRQGGKIEGHLYFIVYIDRHTQTKTAVEDFFYLDKAARRGMNAMRLIRFAVNHLRSEGCVQVGMSSKLTGGRDIDVLLRRAGFRHVANFFALGG